MTTVKVRARLMLWSNAEQYDVWPLLLAQAARSMPDEFSLDEAKVRLGHLPIARGGHRIGQQMLTDLQGFRVLGSETVTIEGVKLLEFVDPWDCTDGAMQRFSPEGLELAELYRRRPQGDEWRVSFAQHLLRYELRTRVLVRCLCVPGHGLRFPKPGGFVEQLSVLAQARLLTLDNREVSLLGSSADGTMHPLGQMLSDQVDWAVGPSWRSVLSAAGATLRGPLTLTTLRGGPITNSDIGSRMKPIFRLLWDLHLLIRDTETGVWSIDRSAFAGTFSDPEVQKDFLEVSQGAHLAELLKAVYKANLGPTGYARTRDLALALAAKLDRSEWEADRLIDQVVSDMQYRGLVRIFGSHAGFSKDGPGLHGDYNRQFLRLDFGRVDK